MRTAEEHAMVIEQLENICRALPWCQGLNWRFSDLKKDALADLYAALEGLSLRFCELLPIHKGPTTKNSLGIALAKYLYDLESLEILRSIDEAYGDDTPEEEAEELRFLNHVGRLTIDALNASGDVWEADR